MKLQADHIGPLAMFKIGVGPSSSHTVGPMVAAMDFRQRLEERVSTLANSDSLRIAVELYGSLSATGKGHGTDGAVCAGLIGLHPRFSDTQDIWAAMPNLIDSPEFKLGSAILKFNPDEDISWQEWLMDGKSLPHPNTIRFRLWQKDKILLEQITASVGGGFIEAIDPLTGQYLTSATEDKTVSLPYPFNTAAEFVAQCNQNDITPWQIIIANQEALGLKEAELRQQLDEILNTMERCIEQGLKTEGILPGGLNVKRRAKNLHAKMLSGQTSDRAANDLRPSVYAIAVNEENAAGGRVVTAPTNGSSGIIPSVWRTLREDHNLSRETLQNGLIVASAIGALVKTHASISGAEVGCQGEVGTSCAMAAAGATAMLGGTINQIEQAAEIGIEHHLGMTCDPIKGLVQIPCIERNAMGAVKALNAVALSLASDGSHLISLDRVLEVMKQTGLDMNQKYKETATGGLALG
ncbi:MAG: L-serine ammonia-lyase [Candidatus Obscuribacterales bacterium]|nr:L-serine ammonia-lyase [Candidatus Obscuribacterales bacterium]